MHLELLDSGQLTCRDQLEQQGRDGAVLCGYPRHQHAEGLWESHERRQTLEVVWCSPRRQPLFREETPGSRTSRQASPGSGKMVRRKEGWQSGLGHSQKVLLCTRRWIGKSVRTAEEFDNVF